MSKTMKKFVLAIALFIGLTFTFLGLTSINPIQAKADASTTYFSMDSGVQLRLASSLENETHYGMRFIASMDETTATTADSFGMLIVPAEYVTDITDGVQYASKITEKGGDYIAAYAELGTAVLNVSGITPYASGTGYKMNGVISDIKYDNLNRDFVAIAYSVVGSDYTYTAVSVPANVYDLAIKALADTNTDYDVEELAVLDEYRFLAEKQTAGVEEQTAKDGVLAYTTAVANIRAGLTGDQVVNFDSDDYVEIVSDALKSKIDIYNGCVTIGNYNKTAFKINLPNPIVVREDTVIRFNLLSPANDDLGDGSGGKTYILFDGKDYNIVAHGNRIQEYTTVTKNLVTDFGRTVGEIITSLTFTAWNSGGSGYTNYNYIEVYSESQIKEKILMSLDGSEVVDFEIPEYVSYIKKDSASSVISLDDGVLTYTTTSRWAFTSFDFLKSYTVKEGDYIALRMQVPAGGRMFIKGKSQIEFVSSNNTIENHYDYAGNTNFQNIIVPLSSIGYSANDSIDNIQIATWDSSTFGSGVTMTYMIDYISLVSMSDDLIADFTIKGNEAAIIGNTYEYNGSTSYYSIGKNATSYDTVEQAVKITFTNYQGVRVYIKPITLTADTTITMIIKESPNDGSTWARCGGIGSTAGYSFGSISNNQWNYKGAEKFAADTWTTLTFNPCTLFGYEEGTIMNHLTFYAKAGTFSIKTISVSNAG